MKAWVVEVCKTSRFGHTHVKEWLYGPSLTKAEVQKRAKVRLERDAYQNQGSYLGSIRLERRA
jgi:hypothetical protein